MAFRGGEDIHSLCALCQLLNQTIHKASIRDVIYSPLIELLVEVRLEIVLVGLDLESQMRLEQIPEISDMRPTRD